MARPDDLFARITTGGVSELASMIRNEETEELFLDYKRSADDGKGTRLHVDDRQNLARAISGFGNSEGGVVVWGVDCRTISGRGDVPSKVVRIEQPNRFKSWLEGAVSGLTLPAHTGVRHEAISDDGGATGFVVSLIPASDHTPHQTVPDAKYLMRSGSNFAPVPHAVLAGLFGRRPQSRLIHKYTVSVPEQLPAKIVQVRFGIFLRNAGPAIAEDLYLNLMFAKLGGDKSSIAIDPPEASLWDGQFSFGLFMSVIAKPHYRLAPEAHLVPFWITWKLLPPFTEPMDFEGSYGARGTQVHKFSRKIPPDKLNEAWELVAMTRPGSPSFKLATDQCTDILFGHLR